MNRQDALNCIISDLKLGADIPPYGLELSRKQCEALIEPLEEVKAVLAQIDVEPEAEGAYEFDRYVSGKLMAESGTITRAKSFEEACEKVGRLWDKHESRTVLVLRRWPSALTAPRIDGADINGELLAVISDLAQQIELSETEYIDESDTQILARHKNIIDKAHAYVIGKEDHSALDAALKNAPRVYSPLNAENVAKDKGK